MINILFIHNCEEEGCDGVAKCLHLDLTQNKDNDCVKINLKLDCSQLELVCDKCGAKYFTDNIKVLSEADRDFYMEIRENI